MLLAIPLSVPVVANATETDTLLEQKQLEIETNKLLAGIKGNASLNDVEKALLIPFQADVNLSLNQVPTEENVVFILDHAPFAVFLILSNAVLK